MLAASAAEETITYWCVSVHGCGSGSGGGSSATGASRDAPATTAAGATATPTTTPLDVGPRANTGTVDAQAAERGEKLFSTKGCSACHAFGRKLTCPDLAGVTGRRTARWITSQILHPEVMTKNDPIAHQLYATFALQMPNQGLTETEALAVIEYFKHREAGAHAASQKGDGR